MVWKGKQHFRRVKTRKEQLTFWDYLGEERQKEETLRTNTCRRKVQIDVEKRENRKKKLRQAAAVFGRTKRDPQKK